MVCFIDRYALFIDNITIWDEPLDANSDYSLPHKRVILNDALSYSPNRYTSLSEILEKKEDTIVGIL